MFTEDLEDIISLEQKINGSEMEFDEILESYPPEIVEEYVSSLEGTPLTVPEKDFVEKYYENY